MKRCVSVLLCLSMVFGLCACQSKVNPADVDSVGSIGETVFSGELYQLLRMNAQQANPQADEEELRQAVLLAMEHYAAVEESFAQLGGEMGTEGQDYVNQYTEGVWTQSGERMSANGVSRETVEAYVGYLYHTDQMLELFYGEEGAQALSDQEILDFIQDNFYYGTCVYLPLTGEDGADIRQDSDAMDTVRKAAQQIQQTVAGGGSAEAAAEQELPGVLALTGGELGEQGVSTYVYPNLYTPYNWQASLSQEAIDKLQDTPVGECVVLENTGDMTVFLRTDPLEDYEVGEMRSYATYYMKNEELEAKLAETGAQLEHKLDQSAMDALWKTDIQL